MDTRLTTIKAKKIGLFLRQARELRHLSIEACAAWMGITAPTYTAIESGDYLPSLPQLESFSYFLNCNFRALTEGSFIDKPDAETNQQLLSLRDRIISVALKHHRIEAGLSLHELANSTGISEVELQGYEEEHLPIPYLHLEALLKVLNLSSDEFFSQTGPLSSQHEKAAGEVEKTNASVEPTSTSQPIIEGLSEEMMDFISKPVNRPYLELAMRLSQMEADKLRAIASSLLEITY